MNLNVALIQPAGMRPEKELGLVKAALLYADRVEISSASLWIARLMVNQGRNVINSLEKYRPVRPGQKTKEYRVNLEMEVEIDIAAAGRTPHYSLGELVEGLDELKSGRMRFRVDKEQDLLDDESLRWGLLEMQCAEQSGLLMPQWDMETVRASLAAGTVVPFWDEVAASEFGFRGPVAPGRRIREGRLATDLLAEAPVFPDAPMDVLLDLRERMERPRARFRVALARAAEELSSVPEADLPGVIEAIRRTTIEESLIEIDETLEELRVKPTLVRMASDRMTTATATATIAVSASGFFGPFNLTALANTVAVPAITAAVKEWSERRRLNQEAARQPYWLLSEVERNDAG
jgi:hypothetical protein